MSAAETAAASSGLMVGAVAADFVGGSLAFACPWVDCPSGLTAAAAAAALGWVLLTLALHCPGSVDLLVP